MLDFVFVAPEHEGGLFLVFVAESSNRTAVGKENSCYNVVRRDFCASFVIIVVTFLRLLHNKWSAINRISLQSNGSPDVFLMTLTNESRRPLLTQGPTDAFVVRNHPATLSCRSLYAERIIFKCNGEWVDLSNHENKQGLDVATNAPYLETRIFVHRQEVEEFFGSQGFSCECYAYGGSNPGGAAVRTAGVKSDPAFVKIAHLRKHFEREPASDRQPLGGTVHVSCLPPEGEPRPEVFWLKDDKEIEPKVDKNLIIAHDGALIIAIARLTDSGNYTCGARNLASHRLSQTVTVTIYVDGSWSEWSHWTGVCPEVCVEEHKRNKPLRQVRYRHCTRPAPINGGQNCQGENEDSKPCDVICTVDGQWSSWSEWSECSSNDCQHSRRRRCDHPVPANGGLNCLGAERMFKNCTIDSCITAKNIAAASSGSDNGAVVNVAMMAGLGAAILVFVLAAVVLLSLLFRRRTCHRCSKDYETAPTGPVYAVLSGQPDLTQHSLYDVPPSLKSDRSRLALLAWSQQNPTDSTDRSRNSPEDQYATVEDPVLEEQENQRNSIISALIPAHLPRVWGRIDQTGGRLDLLEYGVSLHVPEGAVGPNDTAELFLAISADRPRVSDRQTVLSPVVWCGGPTSLAFRKPVVLSVQHCADLSTPSDWCFSIYSSEATVTNEESIQWDLSVGVGNETLNSPVYCQIDTDCVHILTESLCRVAVVGEVSVDSVDSGLKRVRLLTFVSDTSLRVYCISDTRANIQWAVQQEDDLGGRLAADPEQCICIEYGRDLCLYLEDVRPQWRLKSGSNYQEIPSVHLWNPITPALHCSFTLESPANVNRHPTDYLSGRLIVYQKGQQGQRVVLDVDTSVDWPWTPSVQDKECVHLLTSQTKQTLASLLNPPKESGNDWRLLAKHLSVDHYLPYFASRPSPTDLILSLWEARSKNLNDVKQLAQILCNMQRNDAVEVLTSALSET